MAHPAKKIYYRLPLSFAIEATMKEMLKVVATA